MPRRRNSQDPEWEEQQGEALNLEREMRKVRYSERHRPPREFRIPREDRFRHDRRRKSRSKGPFDERSSSRDF
ncbi:MAG: hypothetical protein ACFFB3_11260 [Candidatus Hodarchaeota archaeon]